MLASPLTQAARKDPNSYGAGFADGYASAIDDAIESLQEGLL
jgi:hypothetical protein